MKKNILHYSLLASTSVLAVVAILLGFSQYNNALVTNNVGADSNVAAVAQTATTDTGNTRPQTCSTDPVLLQANNIYLSLMLPNPVAPVTSTCDARNRLIWPGFNGSLQTIYESYGVIPTVICKRPIAVPIAKNIVKDLAAHGIDASFMTSNSNLYIAWSSQYIIYSIAGTLSPFNPNSPNTTYPNTTYEAPRVSYCLDVGYVSDYPSSIKNFLTFYNAHKDKMSFHGNTLVDFLRGKSYSMFDVMGGLEGIDPSIVYATAGSLLSVSEGSAPLPGTRGYTSSATTPTPPGTTASATSSKAYTVSVNYDKFTAEAKTGGYTSVYTTTGTKSVSITVFKFANGSSLTPSQAIAQLAALGYRPATLSELYALKIAQPSVGSSVVGLGTNLGSSYGYPTSSGSGASGLGHSAGPFSTAAYSFAAVHN